MGGTNPINPSHLLYTHLSPRTHSIASSDAPGYTVGVLYNDWNHRSGTLQWQPSRSGSLQLSQEACLFVWEDKRNPLNLIDKPHRQNESPCAVSLTRHCHFVRSAFIQSPQSLLQDLFWLERSIDNNNDAIYLFKFCVKKVALIKLAMHLPFPRHHLASC